MSVFGIELIQSQKHNNLFLYIEDEEETGTTLVHEASSETTLKANKDLVMDFMKR